MRFVLEPIPGNAGAVAIIDTTATGKDRLLEILDDEQAARDICQQLNRGLITPEELEERPAPDHPLRPPYPQ